MWIKISKKVFQNFLRWTKYKNKWYKGGSCDCLSQLMLVWMVVKCWLMGINGWLTVILFCEFHFVEITTTYFVLEFKKKMFINQCHSIIMFTWASGTVMSVPSFTEVGNKCCDFTSIQALSFLSGARFSFDIFYVALMKKVRLRREEFKFIDKLENN